jgi:uncharacterized membrane protein YtjA (UPF0391 family)
MLSWTIRFLLAALGVALVAASDVGAEAAMLAKVVVAVLLALSSVSLIAAWRRSSRDPGRT